MSITLDGSTGISVSGNNNLSIGTLAAGNTTITGTLAANATTITGTLSASANVNLDSGTLFVDGTNNRVGINNTAPTQALTVAGNVSVTGTQFVNGAVTFANSTGNTINFFANGKVSIGANAAWNDLNIYGANNRFVSITSPSGSATRVGVDLNPSMTASEAANNQPQARIYSVDNNYGASIVFANKTQGAIGNSLTDKMQVAATGDVMINTANNTAGGFANKLIIKQTGGTWTGGIGVEAASNDHIISMGSNATHHIIAGSYRTLSGYKPIVLQSGQDNALTIDTSGRVQMPYQICLQAGAPSATYNNGSTVQHWGQSGYVYQNQGSAWNASTGIFTSPISATYMVIAKIRFSSENYTTSSGYNYIQFNNTNSSVNGIPIYLWSAASFAGGTYRPYMLTAIIKLNTNDTISPRLYIYAGGSVTCDGGSTSQTDDQLSIIQIG